MGRDPEPQPSLSSGLPPAADMEQELKVYIEHLYISPLHLSVSFLPASWADISATSGRTAAAGTLSVPACTAVFWQISRTQ